MKKLFNIKYPKLVILIIVAFLAYYIFSQDSIQQWATGLNNLSYIGAFVAGALFSFGFTAPIAVGFFLVAKPGNIYLAAIIGGLGAALSDLIIYKLIKITFLNEIKKLEKTTPIKKLEKIITPKNKIIKHYLIYIFAGIIIASPLPDEVGVSMLAGFTNIKPNILGIIGALCNTIGILIILGIGITL